LQKVDACRSQGDWRRLVSLSQAGVEHFVNFQLFLLTSCLQHHSAAHVEGLAWTQRQRQQTRCEQMRIAVAQRDRLNQAQIEWQMSEMYP